jgi:cyclopropane fatty-acyl-phospholipid synthase-like methyltransferase
MNKMKLTPNIPQYWEMLYEQGKDDWDLGRATPALLEFFEHPLCPKDGDVLVPGAGRGWDAEAWAKRGHNVIAIDFCSSAFDILEKLSDKINNLTALNTDMFLLNPHEKKVYGKKFDIIYDYCSFNSIHPGRRDEYIEMLSKMVKNDGIIIGFFFPLSDEKYKEIPPYSISRSELEVRFNGMFEIENKIVPEKSVKDKTSDRTGREEIWLLRKIP